MNSWVIGTFFGFFVLIVAGLWGCWRSELPISQKCFWTFVILVFPTAGTLFFYLFANEAKDLLS